MNKDVIYIDTEDDITSIIGKIKDSHEKIIALVPPKRIGVLQSAVNLRLLARTATNSNKHLVLITSNKALIALSAASMIPIAKNLQSKPEIAQMDEQEVDENEDIIEGSEMPVGDLVKISDQSQSDEISSDIESINIDGLPEQKDQNNHSKNGVKVPDFQNFRKKFFIIGLAALALAGFLVWAIVFAPFAKIIITAKTSPAPVSATLKIGSVEATDFAKGIIQTVSKQIKKDVSVEFEATGKKDLGVKSSGTMEITRTSISINPLVVPIGTSFTSGDFVFYSTEATTLAATQVGIDGNIQDTKTINVSAAKPGPEYDLSSRTYKSGVVGISAVGSAMNGGTTKPSTVVTAEDIQKASLILANLSSDDVKAQLTKQFTNSEIVIPDSFSVVKAEAVSLPAADTEATGKAKLTSATTFTLLAIAKSEMKTYLDASLAKQVTSSQRVYDNGVDSVKLSGYFTNEQGSTINFSTVGKIGPNIDQDSVKNQAKGKRYGEVQSIISAIKGVNKVDIQFPYFWVRTVPNDNAKIEVEFILENA
ncbi:MAG: hypothetical protein WCQ49_03130 [Candidatus Saccharibacteria bacterium]